MAEIAETVELTFKPLARGWHRCNQTGAKVKKCESYRRSYDNRHRKRVPDAARDLPRVKLLPDGSWVCPRESKHLWFNTYDNRSNVVKMIAVCRCGQSVYISGKEV